MKVLRPLAISLAISTVPLARAADLYVGAKWEADAVVVITRDHRQIVVAKDKDQVGLDQVARWVSTRLPCLPTTLRLGG